MSQPTASANLRHLREYFDDQLFPSIGRGMRPTPCAESIAEPVEAVLAIISRDILRMPTFHPKDSDRVFTIKTSDIGVIIFVPPLLARLRALAPKARIRCVTAAHDQVEGSLELGDIDLAIGYFPDLIGAGLMAEDLFNHSIVCIARKKP